jgi:hypothetical protein
MPKQPVLHPPSTPSREEHINRLIHRGFYPADNIPKEIVRHLQIEPGPAIDGVLDKQSARSMLPKIIGKNVEDIRPGTADITGNTRWCPVVYWILWNRSDNTTPLLSEYLQEFSRMQSDTNRQMALLVLYLLRVSLPSSSSKSGLFPGPKLLLRRAIESAIRILQGVTNE